MPSEAAKSTGQAEQLAELRAQLTQLAQPAQAAEPQPQAGKTAKRSGQLAQLVQPEQAAEPQPRAGKTAKRSNRIEQLAESASRAEQLEFARRIALKLLDAKPRTELELRQGLAKRNVPAEVVDELLQRFTAVGLVDDAGYAAALVSTRSQVSRNGRLKIRQELRRKGIEPELAEQALAGLAAETELATAIAFAERKARSMANLAPQVARRRLFGALARRGFAVEVTYQAVNQALGAIDEQAQATDC